MVGNDGKEGKGPTTMNRELSDVKMRFVVLVTETIIYERIKLIQDIVILADFDN